MNTRLARAVLIVILAIVLPACGILFETGPFRVLGELAVSEAQASLDLLPDTVGVGTTHEVSAVTLTGGCDVGLGSDTEVEYNRFVIRVVPWDYVWRRNRECPSVGLYNFHTVRIRFDRVGAWRVVIFGASTRTPVTLLKDVWVE